VIEKREQARILQRVREICLALPETTERLSHGEPAFFFREKKSFLSMDTDHHGSGHFAAWCAAPLGAQDTLVRSDPETFFVPPYVGYRGWVGMRLDSDPDWDQVKSIVEDAYAQVARPRSRAKR
jgi:hypothetical protein